MLEPRGAEIIRFPGPIPAAECSSPQGPERLRRAVAALDAALAAQRQALVGWHAALADLQGATRGLSRSVQAYRGGVDALGVRVVGLRSETGMLVRHLDGASAS